MKVIVIIGVLAALTACAPQDPILFDGEEFRSKSNPVSDDKRVFRVEVRVTFFPPHSGRSRLPRMCCLSSVLWEVLRADSLESLA